MCGKHRGVTLSEYEAEREGLRMVCGALIVHVCRTRAGTQYLASVAVIWTELIKLLVCVGAQAAECTRTGVQRGLGFREEAMHQTYEILGRSWPMLIPAGLFVMQQVCPISSRADPAEHDPSPGRVIGAQLIHTLWRIASLCDRWTES